VNSSLYSSVLLSSYFLSLLLFMPSILLLLHYTTKRASYLGRERTNGFVPGLCRRGVAIQARQRGASDRSAPFLCSLSSMLRFPPPWIVEKIAGGLKVVDANGQSLAYVYSRETKDAAQIAKVLTEDEARRIAINIAKLPNLVSKGG
jgi:hypothetical protein